MRNREEKPCGTQDLQAGPEKNGKTSDRAEFLSVLPSTKNMWLGVVGAGSGQRTYEPVIYREPKSCA
jgi:hypothetical protein